MTKTLSAIQRFFVEEEGISSVEYALLLAFIGGGVIAGATALSTSVEGEMKDAASCVTNGTTVAGAAC